MKTKIAVAILASLLLSSQAAADAKQYYASKQAHRKVSRDISEHISQGWFEQKVDHSDSQSKYFKQRYYINTEYGSGDDAPIFFYICGEATCHPSSLQGAINTYAKQFHAKLVALEHRYYGKSIPTEDLSTENLKYLSTDAALEDLYAFQQSLKQNSHWKGKWIVFGGSYPGNLSAFYRLNYPEMVVGAIASSAPVQAKADFFEYDRHISRVIDKSCLKNIQMVVKKIDNALNNPQKLKGIKAAFKASHINQPLDFEYLVADIAAAAIQYGMKDKFCAALNDERDSLTGYANFAQTIYQHWQIDPVQLTAQGAESSDPNDYLNGFGQRQWLYQSCREYGYWQNANHDSSNQTRSANINLAYHQQICKRLFNIDVPVDADSMNQRYYLRLLDSSTSNIFFTNGSQDPWSVLSLTKNNGNAHNPYLNYMLIENAAHCDDLRERSDESSHIKRAKEKTSALIKQWLNIA